MFDDVIACPRCGMVGGRTDRFCRYCGGTLDKKGTIREYRHITALFSDLSDYTPLSEELEPEELKDILDTLFTKAISIVTFYKGIVEKFVGDGVIAFFGLDETHEHDTVRAIHAALEIHHVARELNNTVAYVAGRSISMHTGINTGFVLVDQQSQAPFSHGVLGTPINIASRLSDLAGPDEIFIGETVMADAARYFILENMGMKKIKGLKEPMNVCKILSARQAGVSIHRQGGITSDMVGRHKELSVLDSELNSIAHGGISSVCLCGDPGVGKSRLIQEFRAHVPPHIRWICAQCLDHTKDTPYYAIAFLLRDLLEIRENAVSTDELQARIDELQIDPSHAPLIASLCGLAPSIEGMMPEVRKSRLCDAAACLIYAAGKRQPIILCIEDIHWADQSTLDLLEYLLRYEDGACACMFITSSRTKLSLSVREVHIPLDDLTPEETGRMTENMLENRHIPEETRQYLYRRTGGNPFYVEEVVNYLMEKNVSFFQCPGKELCEGIPSTIQGLVAARLENLGTSLKTLLQEASVIGKIFSSSLLKDVSSAGHDVDTHLAGLEKAGFIHQAGPGVYRFRHALTQEVAYRTLLRRDRMKMHLNTGHKLEASCRDKHEICDLLAYHFDLGGDAGKAVFYSIMAAKKYQAEGSWVEAAAHYQTAEKHLGANGALPGSREKLLSVWEGIWSCARIFSPKHAIEALENLCSHYASSGMSPQEAFALIRLINLYSQKGLFQKALDTFDHATFLAGDDEVLCSAALTAVAYTYTYLGRPDRALACLEQARPALDLPDTFLLAVNHLTTLSACVWKGSMQDAMTWYNLTKQVSGSYMDLEIMADIYLGYSYYLCGSFKQARQVFECVALKERKLGSLAGGLSYLRIQSSIYFNARYTGNIDKAREDLRMFAAHEGDMKDSTALYDLYHAWIELEEEKYEQARDLLVTLWQVFQKGIANRVPYALNALAEALYNLGDMKEAAKLTGQCIAWNEQYGNQDQLIQALRIMGDIFIHQDMFDRARDALKRASCMARACSMKPHTAWIMESWGDYFFKKGNKQTSTACYQRAGTLWTRMENSYQASKLSSKAGQ